jgi:hypothetical protein
MLSSSPPYKKLILISIASYLVLISHAFVLPSSHQFCSSVQHHHRHGRHGHGHYQQYLHQQTQQHQQLKCPLLLDRVTTTNKVIYRRQHHVVLNQSKRDGVKRMINPSNSSGAKLKSSRTNSMLAISVALVVSILTTGTVQRVAVSVASYVTAKQTYEIFETTSPSSSSISGSISGSSSKSSSNGKRNRLRQKFQKRGRENDKRKGSKIAIAKEALVKMSDRETKYLQSKNSSGAAWLKQSLDSLEETDRKITELKQREAAAKAAEQQAKAKEWVSETLRSTAGAKAHADMMRKQEEVARHKAKKWAESVARQSGVDLS